MFADMRGAYDALDEAMKLRLAGLVGLAWPARRAGRGQALQGRPGAEPRP